MKILCDGFWMKSRVYNILMMGLGEVLFMGVFD